MACFIEEGRKWFPFIFAITYTGIHFLPSFILFVQGAQLTQFHMILFWDGNPSKILSLNFFMESSENNQNNDFQHKKQIQNATVYLKGTFQNSNICYSKASYCFKRFLKLSNWFANILVMEWKVLLSDGIEKLTVIETGSD